LFPKKGELGMASKSDLKRYHDNLQDEVDSASLYRVIAIVEKQPQLREIYIKMAEVEEEHASFWEKKIADAGARLPTRSISWRSRILGWLARRFGTGFVLPTLVSRERKGYNGYDAQPEANGTLLASQERSHERILNSIAGKDRGGMEGSALAQLEGRHRAGGGNALRAAVLGANDGLLSNLSLVMGVAGASLSNKSILITDTAGLLAGAFSMALGEWLSVQSARELFQHQISIEAREIAGAPEEEEHELALIYQAKGLGEGNARVLAKKIMSDSATTLDTLAREELGVNPEELGGSAWEASFTSFFLFALGAIIPLSPFMFLAGTSAIIVSLAVSGLGMFLIGAAITILTGRNALIAGLRQVLFGLAAAGVTFGIGKLIGSRIGG
jgi:VIT1/CCC1 family predicted Fe2+/Mn2+ transporter